MTVEFNESEMETAGVSEVYARLGAHIPVYRYPISMKEAWRRACLDKKPVWLNTGAEAFSFFPDVIPDNRCRGFCNEEGVSLTDSEKGGRDMFGVKWTYIPVAGGSMEDPSEPHLLQDANEWEEKLIWPDIDSWDFEGCGRRNKKLLENGLFNYIPFMNGCFFERLISFMGFENAAVALIDPDQKEAVKRLFERTSDLFCRIVDKCCDAFDVDGFLVHDDWGGQSGPFFSFQTGREMIVPYMRKLTDHIHSKGRVAELHSCGKNEVQTENFIAAGWDVWMPMADINDTRKLFEKYGDKIVIGIVPDMYDREAPSEIQKMAARKAVEQFCPKQGKACVINKYFTPYIQGAYAKELYRQSRIACGRLESEG